MKRELLIRKLESVETPSILIGGHQRALRQVLLQTYAEKHARKESNPVADGFGQFFDWLRAPAWKAAAASAMVVFVVAAVLAMAFYTFNPSPAVIAADVVKNDPAIQHRLNGNGEIIIVRVDVRDGMASVICGRGTGDFIEADVDINVRTVVQTRRYEGLFMPELPPEMCDRAVKTAILDDRIKAIIDKGGKVGRIFPIFTSITGMTVVNGGYLKVTPEATRAVVPVELNGKTWLVQVNLEEMMTERVIEQQTGTGNYFDIFYTLQNL